MQLVSFDIFRTLGLPGITTLKPQDFLQNLETLRSADWVLFPEYWQLNPLMYGLRCRVFPSQASYLIGHNKIEMVRVFQCLVPGHVPFTLIRANEPQHCDELWALMTAPFVAKLPKSSMGQGVWLIESREDWRRYCGQTPVLYVQEYLPIDGDVRVVIVGETVIAAYWRLQSARGFYNNVAQGGMVDHAKPVPANVIELAARVAGELQVNYAGFDIAVVDGHPYLLEFNRLFGTRGLEGGQQHINQVLLDYLSKELGPTKPHQPRPTRPRMHRAA